MTKKNLIAALLVAGVATIYSCKDEGVKPQGNDGATTKVEQINTIVNRITN